MEFPVASVSREMLFAFLLKIRVTVVKEPRTVRGTDVRFRVFEMIGFYLVARMPLLSKPVNTSGDALYRTCVGQCA